MPVAVLRAWADDVATRTSSRKAAERFGMSVEGLRQFVRADTRPQERTLRKVGEAYLAELKAQRQDAAGSPRHVAEAAAPFGPNGLEEALKGLLSRDREVAASRVKAVFAAARGAPGAEALKKLLLRWIDERYPRGPSGGRDSWWSRG